MIDAFPAAAEKRDWDRMLPLHLACANQALPEVVSALRAAFPAAAQARVKGKTALELCLESPTIVQVLLLAQPADLFKVVERNSCAPAVSALLRERPVEARDHGRKAFSFAKGECRRVLREALFFDGRYELDGGQPAHASATCLLVHATDHGPDSGEVDHGSDSGEDSGEDDHGPDSGEDDHGPDSGEDDHKGSEGVPSGSTTTKRFPRRAERMKGTINRTIDRSIGSIDWFDRSINYSINRLVNQ